jgi:hypothetical protein
MNNFQNIPDETISLILSYLLDIDKANMLFTCRKIKAIMGESSKSLTESVEGFYATNIAATHLTITNSLFTYFQHRPQCFNYAIESVKPMLNYVTHVKVQTIIGATSVAILMGMLAEKTNIVSLSITICALYEVPMVQMGALNAGSTEFFKPRLNIRNPLRNLNILFGRFVEKCKKKTPTIHTVSTQVILKNNYQTDSAYLADRLSVFLQKNKGLEQFIFGYKANAPVIPGITEVLNNNLLQFTNLKILSVRYFENIGQVVAHNKNLHTLNIQGFNPPSFNSFVSFMTNLQQLGHLKILSLTTLSNENFRFRLTDGQILQLKRHTMESIPQCRCLTYIDISGLMFANIEFINDLKVRFPVGQLTAVLGFVRNDNQEAYER